MTDRLRLPGGPRFVELFPVGLDSEEVSWHRDNESFAVPIDRIREVLRYCPDAAWLPVTSVLVTGRTGHEDPEWIQVAGHYDLFLDALNTATSWPLPTELGWPEDLIGCTHDGKPARGGAIQVVSMNDELWVPSTPEEFDIHCFPYETWTPGHWREWWAREDTPGLTPDALYDWLESLVSGDHASRRSTKAGAAILSRSQESRRCYFRWVNDTVPPRLAASLDELWWTHRVLRQWVLEGVAVPV